MGGLLVLKGFHRGPMGRRSCGLIRTPFPDKKEFRNLDRNLTRAWGEVETGASARESA